MGTLRLTDKADLDVYYEADISRFGSEWALEHGITKERFMAYMADCPSIGGEVDGKPIGGVIFNHWKKDAHIAVLPEYHGRWGSLLTQGFKWLFSQEAFFYVSVEQCNTKCLRFLDRMGFERIKEDEKWVRYKMTRTEKINQLINRDAAINASEETLSE